MGITNKLNWRWLCQCLLGLCVSLAPTAHGQIDNRETAHIAIAGPMSGTSVSVGSQFQAGVRAAIALETDGTLLGRELLISEFDDRCQTNVAQSVAENVVSQQPDIVIGHSCSAATLASLPIYAAENILQITPASTATGITEQGIKTLFRMLGRDDQQGQLAAEYLLDRYSAARIGILQFPSSYSQGATSTAISQLETQGADIVAVASAVGSATSYLEQVHQLMSANVDVVYAVGGVLDIGVFTRQATMMQAGFDIVSADSLISAAFPEIAGTGADDVVFSFPVDASDIINPDQFAGVAAAFAQQGDIAARGYALLSYAAIQVWIEGVQRANSFAADEVAAAIRDVAIPTILGNITFNENGDIVTSYPAFTWHQWRDGVSHVME